MAVACGSGFTQLKPTAPVAGLFTAANTMMRLHDAAKETGEVRAAEACEAAEAFRPDFGGEMTLPGNVALPPQTKGAER